MKAQAKNFAALPFDEKIATMKKQNEERLAASAVAKAKAESEEQLSLDLWPDPVRSFPNVVFRSALFGISKIRDVSKKRTLIAAVEGIEIRFKGERFNQTDLDVCEQLLHMAREHPLGSKIEFSAHSLLKALGRDVGDSQHEQLKEDITRLTSGVVEITWTKEKKSFGGALVNAYYRDEVTGRYVIEFSKKIRMLYDSGATYVEWEQRKALGQNNLAKWLHSFYATHANPFPYKVDTLRELCGSVGTLFAFRRQIKTGLQKLQSLGYITSWEIDGADLVHVKKIPTASQKRHLSRS